MPGDSANNEPAPSTVTVTDGDSGKSVTIPVQVDTVGNRFIAASALAPLRLSTVDHGYTNTASAQSAITFIDGERGILQYRGYPIEHLAEHCSFLEVAFLLIYGELPSSSQLSHWEHSVLHHTFLHEDVSSILKEFRYDAHPMGMVVAALASMGTLHADQNPSLAGTNVYQERETRDKQVLRLLGKMPTIAACAYRHRVGRPYNHPVAHLGYSGNFAYMLDCMGEGNYMPNPRLTRVLDTLFILHADHELNCSTAAMRHLASSGVDVYTCISAAAGALYGPLHGGATEAVLRMLESIPGGSAGIPAFVERVKRGEVRLMGFGHRVYRNYDPRAKLIRNLAYEVFAECGKDPLIEVATKLEEVALSDEYFVKRKLYPNVDFYSGLIYKAMGFPTDFFPVLFTIGRTAGWLAHWLELLEGPANDRKIARPKQVYVGRKERRFVPMSERADAPGYTITKSSAVEQRREGHRHLVTAFAKL